MDDLQSPEAVTRNFGEPPEASSLHDMSRDWGNILRSKHLDGLFAVLLDAGRPLALVIAQILYMGWPILGARANGLARLLESESALARLAEDLGRGRDTRPIDSKVGP